MKVLRLVPVALMATLCVFGAVALAQSDHHEAWAPEPGSAPVRASAAELSAFARLASAPDADDSDNHLVVGLVQQADIGMDADGARVVGETSAGRAWLIPAAGALCFAIEDAADGSIGATCEAARDVTARGITIGDGRHVYGLVPDRASSIKVQKDNAPTSTIAVGSDHLYTLDAGHSTVTVGTTSFDVNGGRPG